MAPPEDVSPTHETPSDRRRNRSADALVALSRLFESARRRGGLETLVLADATGLTIAGAGAASVCDELAARAPLLAGPGPANDTIPSRLDVITRQTAVRRLRIDGIEVFLCAESEARVGEAPLADAAAGAERILSRRPTLPRDR